MIRRAMFSVALAVGGLVSPVQAIEMFTNFNNGTELGTRPYGIDVMPAVRYHAYPQGRWFHGPSGGCVDSSVGQAVPVVSSPVDASLRAARIPQSHDSHPTEVRPEFVEPTSSRATPVYEDQWIRSSSFLPPASN